MEQRLRERIDDAVRQLADQPRPPGVTKLAGTSHDWRVRVGDYRVLYEVDDEDRKVVVWRIAHRREVYRRP